MYIISEVYGNNVDTTRCHDKEIAIELGKAAVSISDYVSVVHKETFEVVFEYGIKEEGA